MIVRKNYNNIGKWVLTGAFLFSPISAVAVTIIEVDVNFSRVFFLSDPAPDNTTTNDTAHFTSATDSNTPTDTSSLSFSPNTAPVGTNSSTAGATASSQTTSIDGTFGSGIYASVEAGGPFANPITDHDAANGSLSVRAETSTTLAAAEATASVSYSGQESIGEPDILSTELFITYDYTIRGFTDDASANYEAIIDITQNVNGGQVDFGANPCNGNDFGSGICVVPFDETFLLEQIVFSGSSNVQGEILDSGSGSINVRRSRDEYMSQEVIISARASAQTASLNAVPTPASLLSLLLGLTLLRFNRQKNSAA